MSYKNLSGSAMMHNVGTSSRVSFFEARPIIEKSLTEETEKNTHERIGFLTLFILDL